jgi:hypothetical protein
VTARRPGRRCGGRSSAITARKAFIPAPRTTDRHGTTPSAPAPSAYEQCRLGHRLLDPDYPGLFNPPLRTISRRTRTGKISQKATDSFNRSPLNHSHWCRREATFSNRGGKPMPWLTEGGQYPVDIARKQRLRYRDLTHLKAWLKDKCLGLTNNFRLCCGLLGTICRKKINS